MLISGLKIRKSRLSDGAEACPSPVGGLWNGGLKPGAYDILPCHILLFPVICDFFFLRVVSSSHAALVFSGLCVHVHVWMWVRVCVLDVALPLCMSWGGLAKCCFKNSIVPSSALHQVAFGLPDG